MRLLVMLVLAFVACKKEARHGKDKGKPPGPSQPEQPVTPWDDVRDGRSALRMIPADVEWVIGVVVRGNHDSPVLRRFEELLSAKVKPSLQSCGPRLEAVDWAVIAGRGDQVWVVERGGVDPAVLECLVRAHGLTRDATAGAVWIGKSGRAYASAGKGLVVAGPPEWVRAVVRDARAVEQASAARAAVAGDGGSIGAAALVARVNAAQGIWFVMTQARQMMASSLWGSVGLTREAANGEVHIVFNDATMAQQVVSIIPMMKDQPGTKDMFTRLEAEAVGGTEVVVRLASQGEGLGKVLAEMRVDAPAP